MSEENKHYIEAIIDEAEDIESHLCNAIGVGKEAAIDINIEIRWLLEHRLFSFAGALADRLSRVCESLEYIKQALDKVEVLKDLARKAQDEEGGDTHE